MAIRQATRARRSACISSARSMADRRGTRSPPAANAISLRRDRRPDGHAEGRLGAHRHQRACAQRAAGPGRRAAFQPDRGESWKLLATIKAGHDLQADAVAELPDGRLVLMARPEGDICWSARSRPHLDAARDLWHADVCAEPLRSARWHARVPARFLCARSRRLAGDLQHGRRPHVDRGLQETTAFSWTTATAMARRWNCPTARCSSPTSAPADIARKTRKAMSIRCIRLRIRPDYSGVELLPAPNR